MRLRGWTTAGAAGVVLIFELLASCWTMAGQVSVEFEVALGPAALGKDLYQMAMWVSDAENRHLATVYVTEAVGRLGLGNGYMRLFGIVLREEPGALPVWAWSRGVHYGKKVYPPKTEPLPDAITGATPAVEQFVRTLSITLPGSLASIRPYLEVNVTGDRVPSMVFSGVLPVDLNWSSTELEFVGCGDSQGRSGRLQGDCGKGAPERFVRRVQVRLVPETQ